MTKQNETATLIYDPECPLCVRFKQALERISKKEDLHFASLRDQDFFEQHPYLNLEECRKTLHLVVNEREIYKGPEAIDFLAHHLPLCKPFLWLIDSSKGQAAVKYFYEKADELRQRVKNSCHECP